MRFDEGVLNEIKLEYSELVLKITTGETYPAEQLSFEITNLTLSRRDLDLLRAQLRGVVQEDAKINNRCVWASKEMEAAYGNFEFRHTALAIVNATVQYLKTYQSKPLPTMQETQSVCVQEDDKNVLSGITSIEDILAEITPFYRVSNIDKTRPAALERKFLAKQVKIKA